MKCIYCGTEAKAGAKYCEKCGKPLPQQQQTTQQHKQSVQIQTEQKKRQQYSCLYTRVFTYYCDYCHIWSISK